MYGINCEKKGMFKSISPIITTASEKILVGGITEPCMKVGHSRLLHSSFLFLLLSLTTEQNQGRKVDEWTNEQQC